MRAMPGFQTRKTKYLIPAGLDARQQRTMTVKARDDKLPGLAGHLTDVRKGVVGVPFVQCQSAPCCLSYF
jgi:hypothetical protein